MVILQRTSKQEHSCPFQGINFTQIADNQRIRVRSTRFEKTPPIKKPGLIDRVLLKAEREGFEPPVPCGTAVFKTAAIDHSAISPVVMQR